MPTLFSGPVKCNPKDVVIEKINDGAAACAFRISRTFSIPDGTEYLQSGTRRSGKAADIRVDTVVTLGLNDRHVRCQATIHNTVSEHRLRLSLPTGITGGSYKANQAYCFVERGVGPDRSTGDWKEPETGYKGFESILYKRSADGGGLAFISAYGLHECYGADDIEGTLYITMIRAFKNTVSTDGQPDGGLIGESRYDFILKPLLPSDSDADLIRLQSSLACGIYTRTTRVNRPDKTTDSFMNVQSDNVIVTTVKPPYENSDKAAIVRLCNYSDKASTAKITFKQKIKKVIQTNLLEEKESELKASANFFTATLSKHKIATFRIEF